MQKMTIKKNSDPKRKTKSVIITQKTQDAESFTFVKKAFVYNIRKTSQIKPEAQAPQIFIRKFFDTKRGVESFRLQVIGSFYINHERMLLKVNFKHTLNIQILWKSKTFSPKKPAVLAE